MPHDRLRRVAVHLPHDFEGRAFATTIEWHAEDVLLCFFAMVKGAQRYHRCDLTSSPCECGLRLPPLCSPKRKRRRCGWVFVKRIHYGPLTGFQFENLLRIQ
jgi:hypothetical protein